MSEPKAEAAGKRKPQGCTWYLTRFVLLRFLGFVYAVAFLIAARQIVPLIGQNGLTPAQPFMALVQDHFGSRLEAALNLPSFFWWGISDRLLVEVAWAGFALSLVVMAGYANSIMMAALWATYMSYVHIGQSGTATGGKSRRSRRVFSRFFFVRCSIRGRSRAGRRRFSSCGFTGGSDSGSWSGRG